jgi:carbon-monoxide dehydrogenase small subunit
MELSLAINGKDVDGDVEPRVLLVDFIRDNQGLTGTKVGCETGQCGSCVVLLDGRSVKSCSMLAVQAEGRSVTTIEGIEDDAGLDEFQQALWEQHGVQCGFCTPGVVIAMRDRLSRKEEVTESDIRAWLAGNLCRCTGYQSIVRAALAASGGPEGASS